MTMRAPENQINCDEEGVFVAENADFFAQAFAVLRHVFDNRGTMRIVSEEEGITVAVGVREPDAVGGVDVDCVILEPNQESLCSCLDTLFTDD